LEPVSFSLPLLAIAPMRTAPRANAVPTWAHVGHFRNPCQVRFEKAANPPPVGAGLPGVGELTAVETGIASASFGGGGGGCVASVSSKVLPARETCSVHVVPSQYRCSNRSVGSGSQPAPSVIACPSKRPMPEWDVTALQKRSATLALITQGTSVLQ